MRPEQIALVIMAGGQSRRFGAQDKLQAELRGQPLGLHAARRFASLDWAQKLAVTRPPLTMALTKIGFLCLEPKAENGLGDNLALTARELGDVAAALILLADMPFVSVAHIAKLMSAATSSSSIVCTLHDDIRSPPVLIGRSYFPALQTLSNDEGARKLIHIAGENLTEITAEASVVADIDTVDELNLWQ